MPEDEFELAVIAEGAKDESHARILMSLRPLPVDVELLRSLCDQIKDSVWSILKARGLVTEASSEISIAAAPSKTQLH